MDSFFGGREILADNDVMRVASLADEALKPFPRPSLAELLATAAVDRPNAALFLDDDGLTTAADAAIRVRLTAAQFRSFGLRAGERILIMTGAQTAAIVALAAALDIGAEPALAPCALGPVEIAAHARAAGAVAIVGPARYGALELGEAYLSAAAIVDKVRVIATQGPDPVDGAIDLSAAALGEAAEKDAPASGSMEPSVIVTFQGPVAAPSVVLHRQAALFADALLIVEAARIGPSHRIVSTLPPVTMAGLVAGPFAALAGATSLSLHGPFDAKRLLAALDAERGAHLIAPAASGTIFADERLAGTLASLILVSRARDAQSLTPLPPLACQTPIVDVQTFTEETFVVRRRVDGEVGRAIDQNAVGSLGARLNRARADLGPRTAERS